jgi:hypothetical protein
MAATGDYFTNFLKESKNSEKDIMRHVWGHDTVPNVTIPFPYYCSSKTMVGYFLL